jgi:hypothetical protein
MNKMTKTKYNKYAKRSASLVRTKISDCTIQKLKTENMLQKARRKQESLKLYLPTEMEI